MNKNHLKILTAGLLSTVLLGVSTPAIALETSQTATTQNPAPSWGLDRINQSDLPLDGIFTSEANAGLGVSIYVVDGGIRADHVDFKGRIANGFSVVNKSFSSEADTSDCDGHGTHVAGIAAGTTYGVAKSATIIPVRVSNNECNETHENVTKGLKWVLEHHQEGIPAVVNISIAGDVNAELDAAVTDLIAEGITVVAGAGNSTKDACTMSPGHVADAITVSASTRYDNPLAYSNFGSCVDIYAPGDNIFSDFHTSDTATEMLTGTSMASPHVAGAAAVILSRHPTFTPEQVTSEIINTSTVDLLRDLYPGTPNRLLFLSAETVAPAPGVTVPASPSNVVASASVGNAYVKWTKGEDGGSEITGHTINVYENDIKYSTVAAAGKANEKFINLPKGKTFTFSVTARNAIGAGAESAHSQPVTIPSATAPSAPTVVAMPLHPGWAEVEWTDGADGGSEITGHTVHAYEEGIQYSTYYLPGAYSTDGKGGIRISDLPQGRTFTFTITATNAIGTSPESVHSQPVTIASDVTAPSAPTNTRAAPVTTGGSANVYWDAASDGGSAITSYEITVYNGGNVVKTVKVPASYKAVYITGLYNETYYHFTIKAINNVGASPESNATNTINPVAKAPGTATNVRAVEGDNTATIYWTRGSENGAPLTSQLVTVYSGTTKVGTATVSGTTSSVRLTGLTEGRAVSFTITEVNKIGSSPESAKTDIVKPF